MDPSQLQPGYRLDRYELLCPLAYGGMASVWLARFGGRLGFERLVVIKMILPQYSQDPRFQEMFLDEARIASKIEHSNVARILDVGEHDGSYFIVMEWVDGDSLSKLSRAAEQNRTRLPTGVALRICADAAAGLHAAHVLKDRDGTDLCVVHRDVSPQNLLIANSGATMLIDFGVAKARDRVSQETSAGQIKGKIRYMAPEQARGLAIDHRADVWALGAILYELLAGVAPFEGANEVATLHKLTSGIAPPPLPEDVPAPVRDVVSRAIAFDPDERFATALDFSLALEAAMVEIGEPTAMAVVAQYTGQLLAERKAARKKAVDAALARSQAGSAQHPTKGTIRLVETPAPFPVSVGGQTAAMLQPPVPPPPPPSSPSNMSGPSGSLGTYRPIMQTSHELAESPSGASSRTLGSAAVEYAREDEQASRQRRVMGIAIGVSLAALIIGVALIVNFLANSRRDAPPSLAAQPPPAATTSPIPTDTPAIIATGAAEDPGPSPRDPSEPGPTAGQTVATKPSASPGTTTHARPTTSPATNPIKPPVAKPANTGKKDYGF